MSPGRSSGEDERGQSNVLGYLLLIAIIVGGTSLVVVIGADALGQTNSQSELKRAEQTMTLFDSRAAMVALGTSDVQSLQVKQQSGSFETRPDAGKLWIRHVGYEKDEAEIIYEDTLGAVVYENGNTEIAYQGGGVWRLDARGAAQMISPPEFHYRGQTLTLPIIRVLGESSASGSPTVTVAAEQQAALVYPNRSTDLSSASNGTGAPYDYKGDGRHYTNPIEKGTVRVFVQGDYYQGWAEYFRERTSGTVKVYDSNQTVRLTLVSLGGAPGQFPIPDEGVAQPIGGVADEHPLEQFDLTLNADKNFNGESHWSMYAVEDGKEMEIHVEMDNGGGCRNAKIAFYFNGPSTYEEWESPWLSPGSTSAYDCTTTASGDEELNFDLTATDVDMAYEDVSVNGQASGKWCFDVNQAAPSSTTIDAHGIDTGPDDGKYDPGSISTGHTETLNWTTSHYVSRMGSKYDLRVQDSQGSAPPQCDSSKKGKGGSNMIDEGQSVGVLEYTEASGAQFITFLHVTENEIEVDFD
jgi:FlaG/FlaF family flagellin (archaellin)